MEGGWELIFVMSTDSTTLGQLFTDSATLGQLSKDGAGLPPGLLIVGQCLGGRSAAEHTEGSPGVYDGADGASV